MWALLGNLLGGITGAVGKILPDRNRQNDAQSRINEAEVGGAPASMVRLWRSFLGWMLSLLFCWEVAGRLIIIPLLFPGWNTNKTAVMHLVTAIPRKYGNPFKRISSRFS